MSDQVIRGAGLAAEACVSDGDVGGVQGGVVVEVDEVSEARVVEGAAANDRVGAGRDGEERALADAHPRGVFAWVGSDRCRVSAWARSDCCCCCFGGGGCVYVTGKE